MVVDLLMMISVAVMALIIMIIGKHRATKNILPPGPPPLPFIGNLLHIQKPNLHMHLWRLSRTYGPLASLRHGSSPVLLVSSSKTAKQILKTHDLSFCSRPRVLGQQKLSYGGLDMAFSPYNHHWREMRKICLVHLLSAKRVLSFRPILEDEVSRMIQKMLHGGPADLSAMAMSLASNLICRVAFGRRYNDDEYEKKRMDKLVLEAQALLVSFYFSDHFPVLSWVDNVSGLLKRLRKNCQELDVFYQQLIDEHLDPSRPEPEREDIIDLMIQLMKNQKQSSSLDLTWDHIKALLMNLFIAGTDTVAASIVWTMTALMLRPPIMKKAQLLIRQAIGRKPSVDADDIERLPYLKAVVLEALRLYPPAPLLYRDQRLGQEEYCTVEGYKVGPGTSIIINAWAIGRDPETWEDPDEFRPERFKTSVFDGKMRGGNEFEMIPFGGGRRGCPGVGLGLPAIELAVANLLYSFDWALPVGEQNIDTDALPGLTMHKKNALVLVPTPYV